MPEPTPPRPAQRPRQRPVQRRKIYTGANIFDFDHALIPPEMTYQWKRVSCGGQEDKQNQILAELNGWEKVPANRHPELSGHNAGEEPIVRGGLMLMEQPKEWAQESADIDKFSARQALEEQVARLHGTSGKEGGVKGGIKRQVAALDLIE
jgi:hypothetical protein